MGLIPRACEPVARGAQRPVWEHGALGAMPAPSPSLSSPLHTHTTKPSRPALPSSPGLPGKGLRSAWADTLDSWARGRGAEGGARQARRSGPRGGPRAPAPMAACATCGPGRSEEPCLAVTPARITVGSQDRDPPRGMVQGADSAGHLQLCSGQEAALGNSVCSTQIRACLRQVESRPSRSP